MDNNMAYVWQVAERETIYNIDEELYKVVFDTKYELGIQDEQNNKEYLVDGLAKDYLKEHISLKFKIGENEIEIINTIYCNLKITHIFLEDGCKSMDDIRARFYQKQPGSS